eukprot:SAG31_NODE_2375_length_5842_cov_1.832318_2_plen_244_part_00
MFLNTPGWLQHGDTPDIAALIAPRPLLLNFGENDSGSPIAHVRHGLATIAARYAAAGAPAAFSHYIEAGSGHVLSQEMWRRTLDFFKVNLARGAKSRQTPPQPISRDLSSPPAMVAPLPSAGTQFELRPKTPADWTKTRTSIYAQFSDFLGSPSMAASEAGKCKLVRQFSVGKCAARLYEQQTGPSSKQLVLILAPAERVAGIEAGQQDLFSVPSAVVPFYHPDESAGVNLRDCKLLPSSLPL